jgi:hypothetical protein
MIGDADIYVSPVGADGAVGLPVLAQGLNTSADDSRPHVRRDALEIFFDSTRAGGLGGADIWSSTRDTPVGAWSVPVNLGPIPGGPLSSTGLSASPCRVSESDRAS